MRAALEPETPAPRMVIFAGGTPGTPPSRMPMPPRSFSRQLARTRLFIRRIRGADARACIRLHDHLVAVRGDLAHRGGREADAVLVRLDFLGNADNHCCRAFASASTTDVCSPSSILAIWLRCTSSGPSAK